jgi:hypothetical protein
MANPPSIAPGPAGTRIVIVPSDEPLTLTVEIRPPQPKPK